MNKDCVSLEVAKELQAAGYKGKCVYRHKMVDGKIRLTSTGHVDEECYEAPTATQLAEELPDEYPGASDYDLQILKMPTLDGTEDRRWLVRYCSESLEDCTGEGQWCPTLPDALGKCLVYLLKNGMIKGNDKE